MYELKMNPGKKHELPEGELGFGKYFTDNMLMIDYAEGTGWHNARIVPYGPISLDPAAMVLHYAQELFEGLKAYRTPSGEIQLFRPDKNFKRLNNSADRLCIPEIDEDYLLYCTKELIRTEASWVPSSEGSSLYIRPFIIATEPHIGVRPASTYLLMVILSPVGSYYPEGINPIKIYVETEYVRAVKGGTGQEKVGGNYASSLIAQAKAKKEGYTQVLWLDGVERKYIEEVGTMNVFFKINGKIVTPSLEGSILPGITRMSCIELLQSMGYTVEERRVSLSEVVEAAQSGSLEEMFGTGTAAVVSPVGELRIDGISYEICGNKIGEIALMLYDRLTGIQYGRLPDTMGWTVKI